MKIPEITITADEMVSAVQSFLQTNGINIPVKSVEKNYRGGTNSSWLVTLTDIDEATPETSPATLET